MPALLVLFLFGCDSGSMFEESTSEDKPVINELIEIQLSPKNPILKGTASLSLKVGLTQRFSITGIYANGSRKDLASLATWYSSTADLVTSSGDMITAIAAGETFLSVYYQGIESNEIKLSITEPILTELKLILPQTQLQLGHSQQVQVIGTYDDKSRTDLTEQVNWNIENPAIIKIANGLITATQVGKTNLSVSLKGIESNKIELTVTDVSLSYLQLTPISSNLPVGGKVKLSLVAVYTDGTSFPVLTEHSWDIDKPSLILINGFSITAIKEGKVVLSARYKGEQSNPVELNISAAKLLELQINTTNIQLIKGMFKQVNAIGRYTDGDEQDLTNKVVWHIENTNIATSDNGLIFGNNTGQTNVKVTIEELESPNVPIMVTEAELTQLNVLIEQPSIAVGFSTALFAQATYSDGSQKDLTEHVNWSSNDESVAQINGTMAVGRKTGQAYINASLGDAIADPQLINVTEELLVSIGIAPEQVSLAKGQSTQLKAMGRYSDGSEKDITTVAHWLTDNVNIATVYNGFISGVNTGQANATAQLDDIEVSVPISVTEAELIDIELTPASLNLALGQKEKITAKGLYSDGQTLDITSPMLWISESSSIASLSDDETTPDNPSVKIVNALSEGSTNVIVSSGDVQTRLPVLVSSAELTSLEITPKTLNLVSGLSGSLIATGFYSDGSTKNITELTRWDSDNEQIATVDKGLVNALAKGNTSINASIDGITNSASIEVAQPKLLSMLATPNNVTIEAGSSAQISITGLYSNETQQNITNQVSWSSAAPDKVSVDNGNILGLTQGASSVTATLEDISVDIPVTVTAPRLISLQLLPTTVTLVSGRNASVQLFGTYSDGNEQNLTQIATWSSNDSNIAGVNSGIISGVQEGQVIIIASVGELEARLPVNVTAAELNYIELSPNNLSLINGQTGNLNAIGVYSDGSRKNVTSDANWQSESPAIAQVANGIVSSQAEGSTQIIATLNDLYANAKVTITAAELLTISAEPTSVSLAQGLTAGIKLIGSYTDGTTKPITSGVNWLSQQPEIATVDNGLIKALKTGNTTVTARIKELETNIKVSVLAAELLAIRFTPASVSMINGVTTEVTAQALFSDESVEDITTSAQWQTQNPAIATVNDGMISAKGVGQTSISATKDDVSAPLSVTVTETELSRIELIPNELTITKGLSQRFEAIGYYDNGSSKNISSEVSWQSRSVLIANVTGGDVTGVSEGSTEIIASQSEVTAKASVTVEPPTLLSLTSSSDQVTLADGLSQSIVIKGLFTDNSEKNLTDEVQWSVDDPSVATVSAGQITATAVGSTKITASINQISVALSVTVTEAELIQIELSDTRLNLIEALTTTITATGLYTNNSRQDITQLVTWRSDNTSIATVENGLITAESVGDTKIHARLGIIDAKLSVEVVSAELIEIILEPNERTIIRGQKTAFTAIGRYNNNSRKDLTTLASWRSSAEEIASVSQGIVQGLEVGNVQITASYNDKTSSGSVTVTPPNLIALSADPKELKIINGLTAQVEITGWYSDSSTQILTDQVEWTSSDLNIVTVNNGTLTALSTGSTRISASKETHQVNIQVIVTNAEVVSLAFTPDSLSLPEGLTQQTTVTGTYTDGSEQDLTDSVSWTIEDTRIAKVEAGLVTAIAQGNTQIKAIYEQIDAVFALIVTNPELSSIKLTPDALNLAKGQRANLTAEGTYTNGSTEIITDNIEWYTISEEIATVSRGTVSALAEGVTAVVALQGVNNAIAPIRVSPAKLMSMTASPDPVSLVDGLTTQVEVIGQYSDNTTKNITTDVSWQSSDPNIVTVSAGRLSGQSAGSAIVTAMLSGVETLIEVNVTPSELTELIINPNLLTLANGLSKTINVTGRYTDGHSEEVTEQVIWKLNDPSIASIQGNTVSANNVGSAQATATINEVQAQLTINVTEAQLTQIQLSPAELTIANGQTAQFTATGTYTDESTIIITDDVTWSTQAPNIAQVTNGLVTGKSQGETSISASQAEIIANGSVKIGPPVLIELKAVPLEITLAKGMEQRLEIIGIYSDQSENYVTDQVTLDSNNSNIAAVDGNLVIGAGTGSTNIRASLNDINTQVPVTVTAEELVRIELSPISASIAKGLSEQIIATGIYTDASTQTLTLTANWQSNDARIATVSQGSVSAKSLGSTQVTASVDDIAASLPITVTAAELMSLSLSPAKLSINNGLSETFLVTGTYTDQSTQELTNEVLWSSDDSSIAQVEAGVVTGKSVGNTKINATQANISTRGDVTITKALLTNLVATPNVITLPKGGRESIEVIGEYSDQSSDILTNQVQYNSQDPNIAMFSNGNINALELGSTVITASLDDVSVLIEVTVEAAELIDITIEPDAISIAEGLTSELSAMGTYTDGSRVSITQNATWQSNNNEIASVNKGIVSALNQGSTSISASFNEFSASADVSITPAELERLVIDPSSLSVAAGTEGQLNAIGTYTNGDTETLTEQVSWTSDSEAIATVDLGLIKGITQGTTQIRATINTSSANSLNSNASIEITEPILVSISASPSEFSIANGHSESVVVTAEYSDGSTEDATNSVTWTFEPEEIATIENGLITAVAVGITTATATLEQQNTNINISVTDPILTDISLSPETIVLSIGSTETILVNGLYSDGSTEDVSAQATWQSNDTEIATVSNEGMVTAISEGLTSISATVSEYSAEMLVTSENTIQSLMISPNKFTLPLHSTQKFTALAKYSDGSLSNVTASTRWENSDSSVTSISEEGVVYTLSTGSSEITASFDTLTSETALITVEESTLTSLTINSKYGTTVPLGFAFPLTVTASYLIPATEEGEEPSETIINVTTAVDWVLDAPEVAEIINGQLSSLAVGSVNLTVELAGVSSASTTFTITEDNLETIALTASTGTKTIYQGYHSVLTATGQFSSEIELDLSEQVQWTADSPGILSIDDQGLALGLSEGTTNVIASLGELTSDAIALSVGGTSETLPVCGNINDTDKTIAIEACLKLASNETGMWFTAAPSTTAVQWLGYTETNSNAARTYVADYAESNGHGPLGSQFARFTSINGDVGGKNNQFDNWCQDLASMGFAGRYNWQRPSETELLSLFNANGGSLWDGGANGGLGWPTTSYYFTRSTEHTADWDAWYAINMDTGGRRANEGTGKQAGSCVSQNSSLRDTVFNHD